MNKKDLITEINKIQYNFNDDVENIKEEYKKRTKESMEKIINNYLIDNNFDKKISVDINIQYKNYSDDIITVGFIIFYDNKPIDPNYIYKNDIFKILDMLNVEKENMVIKED